MTTPDEEQPRTETTPVPTVSTAPPRSRWRFGNVPARLGRARTSTVVLAVLWMGVFALYLAVRPPSPDAAPAGTTGDVNAPVAPASTSAAPPATTTSEAPTPSSTSRTTTGGSTTTSSSSSPPSSEEPSGSVGGTTSTGTGSSAAGRSSSSSSAGSSAPAATTASAPTS